MNRCRAFAALLAMLFLSSCSAGSSSVPGKPELEATVPATSADSQNAESEKTPDESSVPNSVVPGQTQKEQNILSSREEYRVPVLKTGIDGMITHYGYNGAGEQVEIFSETDEFSRLTSLQYHDMGYCISEKTTFSDGSEPEVTTYTCVDDVPVYAEVKQGDLWLKTEEYQYDQNGLPTCCHTVWFGGTEKPTGGIAQTVQYVYDEKLRLQDELSFIDGSKELVEERHYYYEENSDQPERQEYLNHNSDSGRTVTYYYNEDGSLKYKCYSPFEEEGTEVEVYEYLPLKEALGEPCTEEPSLTIADGDSLTLTGVVFEGGFMLNDLFGSRTKLLLLDTPLVVRLQGEERTVRISSVQLGMDEEITGETITVWGTAMFAHSPYHIRDIVLMPA